MEKFKISLANQYDNRSKNQPYYFQILGIVYLILGTVYFLKDNTIYSLAWIWVFSGIAFMYYGYFYFSTSNNSFEIGNDYIKASLPLSKGFEISWNDLEYIHIKPISVELKLKDGTSKEISLGNVAYKDVIKTKEVLNELANEKNIKVN